MAAESRDGGRTFAVARVSDEPVKEGKMCPHGSICGSNNRELFDYVAAAYDAEGHLSVAHAKSRMVDGEKAGLVLYAGPAR